MLDPGQCWTRTGFAGEDTPKTVTPSHYGLVRGADDDDDDDGARKLYFGDNDVHAVRAGMEILNPMSDGIGGSPNRFVAIGERGWEGTDWHWQWPTGTWLQRCGATR